ncbi:ESCRT-II subunit protein VPS25 [Sporobolomyces salmoneus]|uniref:ESCRT-II subunit protein VPS25 n=1 Tax=Sporobolomyces salmoneus TaxID=183962 RepID=UPI003179224D
MESTSTSAVSSQLPAPSNTSNSKPTSTPRLTLTRHLSPTTSYLFPSLYSFPPFFTRQPNLSVWSHQRSQWIRLILSHCRHTKTSLLYLSETAINENELWSNEKIGRSLNRENVLEVLKFMAGSTNPPQVEFLKSWTTGTGGTKGGGATESEACYVYWKTPSEWAETIYGWIKETGQIGSILTFYELIESDDSLDFYRLPEGLLRKVLEILQRQGKCQVLRGTLGEDGDGVKFV